MSTLREAVESGRRWRLKGSTIWMGPGAIAWTWTTEQALSSDFEIEPEPEPEKRLPTITLRADTGGYIRVHDADACDRLHKNCGVPR